MSIENIIFEDTDTIKDTLTKVVLLHCGTTELKKELKKHGITNYTKVCKGAHTTYVLRSEKIGEIKVRL